jgi:hypothetical protein
MNARQCPTTPVLDDAPEDLGGRRRAPSQKRHPIRPVSGDGQHLVKEPTEPDGTRRYSCDTVNPLRPAEVLVRTLRVTSLTRKRSSKPAVSPQWSILPASLCTLTAA